MMYFGKDNRRFRQFDLPIGAGGRRRRPDSVAHENVAVGGGGGETDGPPLAERVGELRDAVGGRRLLGETHVRHRA